MAGLSLDQPHKTGQICPECEELIEWRMEGAKVVLGPIENGAAKVSVEYGLIQIRCGCSWRTLGEPDGG